MDTNDMAANENEDSAKNSAEQIREIEDTVFQARLSLRQARDTLENTTFDSSIFGNFPAARDFAETVRNAQHTAIVSMIEQEQAMDSFERTATELRLRRETEQADSAKKQEAQAVHETPDAPEQ